MCTTEAQFNHHVPRHHILRVCVCVCVRVCVCVCVPPLIVPAGVNSTSFPVDVVGNDKTHYKRKGRGAHDIQRSLEKQ